MSRTILVKILAFVVTLIGTCKASVADPCQNCEEAIAQCYSSNGLEPPDDLSYLAKEACTPPTYESSEESDGISTPEESYASVHITEHMFSQLATALKYCHKQDNLIKAYECTIQLGTTCQQIQAVNMTDWKTAFEESLKQMCMYKGSFDVNCLESKWELTLKCETDIKKNSTLQSGSADVFAEHNVTCASRQLQLTCRQQLLRPCGCGTVRYFTDRFTQRWPAECIPQIPDPVACDPHGLATPSCFVNMALLAALNLVAYYVS
ncbi:uncharacterized protein LOC101849192 [Aplysia californica]|uniref:Uncharacterized protein LOC101849192 n=1 Tax=Aplysia californica TaxID=6500 RepID=A0ABM0JIW2_APLCA|nr:uncharacterized protein LOC101849192 [Aplysia californica]